MAYCDGFGGSMTPNSIFRPLCSSKSNGFFAVFMAVLAVFDRLWPFLFMYGGLDCSEGYAWHIVMGLGSY